MKDERSYSDQQSSMEPSIHKECTPVGNSLNGNFTFHFNSTQHYSYRTTGTNTSANLEFSNDDVYEYVEWILYARVTVAIAVFGILGNALNLIILTRRKLKSSMDRMERYFSTSEVVHVVSVSVASLHAGPFCRGTERQFKSNTQERNTSAQRSSCRATSSLTT